MDTLLLLVAAVLVIATVTTLAQHVRIAGPLLLMGLGLGVALLPWVPPIEVDPEWILVGVLPPLLYAAAVRLPAIEFRRDFTPIAGLAVLLVVVSSLLLGLFFTLVIPGLGFPLAVALGAILSPTDAVATSIVKRLGISPRVVTMLEGESLLNDATALVLLRTAIAAVAGGFSLWGAVGDFAGGVLIAVLMGAVIGMLVLRLRAWITNPAANTAVSFTIPFLAYLPTEHVGGSGLVAAVVAGIVAGQGAHRWLSAEHRVSDEVNWRTIELVLEGGVFLVMGLELKSLVEASFDHQHGPLHALWLAASALGIILAVRALYVALLVSAQGQRARAKQRARLHELGVQLDAAAERAPHRSTPERAARRARSMRTRMSRMLADLDYYQATPLGWRHGSIIVWAGMRGVVTLAAAQTLPRDADERSLLVLTAFFVAVMSLLLQGLTLPWLVRALRTPDEGGDAASADEQQRLDDELRAAALSVLNGPALHKRDGDPFDPELLASIETTMARPPDDDTAAVRDRFELRLLLIEAMRLRLHELSHGGTFSTAALRHTSARLDADEISLQFRLDDRD